MFDVQTFITKLKREGKNDEVVNLNFILSYLKILKTCTIKYKMYEARV